jgi:hypothetical protein
MESYTLSIDDDELAGGVKAQRHRRANHGSDREQNPTMTTVEPVVRQLREATRFHLLLVEPESCWWT